MKELAVIILNYNGTTDTLACLDSIKKYESIDTFSVLVLDNGSKKAQWNALCSGAESYHPTVYESLTDLSKGNIKSGITLIRSDVNYGFAKGNNLCVKRAMELGFDYFLLMNNDTEIAEDSISQLYKAIRNHAEYAAMSTVINYWSDKNKVWNAGGKIYAGTRKYYLNTDVEQWKKENKSVVQVDFLTGCFLMMKRECLEKYGLLTENFFFGEEDYEFALRYKKEKLKQGVMTGTTIYHKVGQSTKNNKNTSRIFIHHLNRNINMRGYYSVWRWNIWHALFQCYQAVQLLKNGQRVSEIWNYTVNMHNFSISHESVTRDMFEWVMQHDMSECVYHELPESIR